MKSRENENLCFSRALFSHHVSFSISTFVRILLPFNNIIIIIIAMAHTTVAPRI
jgi:hypothetical protein